MNFKENASSSSNTEVPGRERERKSGHGLNPSWPPLVQI